MSAHGKQPEGEFKFKWFLFMQMGQALLELKKRAGIEPEDVPLYLTSDEWKAAKKLAFRHLEKKVEETGILAEAAGRPSESKT